MSCAILAQDAPTLKYLSHDFVCSSDRARRNSCAVCHGGSSCGDFGGTRKVRRTSARGSSFFERLIKFDIFCFLDSIFNIVTLDHEETKNNPLLDTFITRSTELSWKLGRHESGQHQASCESLRLPRRSRRVCVGFSLTSKFGSCFWPSVLRVVVFLHEPGASHHRSP